jgi:hypothetical protein
MTEIALSARPTDQYFPGDEWVAANRPVGDIDTPRKINAGALC